MSHEQKTKITFQLGVITWQLSRLCFDKAGSLFEDSERLLCLPRGQVRTSGWKFFCTSPYIVRCLIVKGYAMRLFPPTNSTVVLAGRALQRAQGTTFLPVTIDSGTKLLLPSFCTVALFVLLEPTGPLNGPHLIQELYGKS